MTKKKEGKKDGKSRGKKRNIKEREGMREEMEGKEIRGVDLRKGEERAGKQGRG